MSKVKELLNSGVVTLFHDYRLGHCQDLSGNANHGVLSGTKKFENKGIIDPGTTGYVSLPTKPLLFTPDASIFIVAEYFPLKTIANGANRTIIREITSVATTYFYLDYSVGTQNIALYKVVPYLYTYKVASKPFTYTKCLGFTYSSGDKPKFYTDGSYENQFSTNWIPAGGVPSTVDILGISGSINPCMQCFMCTNTQLSDSEVAQVTSELVRQEY